MFTVNWIPAKANAPKSVANSRIDEIANLRLTLMFSLPACVYNTEAGEPG